MVMASGETHRIMVDDISLLSLRKIIHTQQLHRSNNNEKQQSRKVTIAEAILTI